MPSLVTRFHLLIFIVTLAIAGVAVIHIPQTYAFPAHWRGSTIDWLWPRNIALAAAPALQLLLMGTFFFLGLALTKNHLAKTRHILDPALSLLLSIAAALQLGLLFNGIGSDIDMFRITAFALSATLLVLAVVIYEAERHSYAGLRMPWPIPSDRAWQVVHRISGIASGLAAIALAWMAWIDPGPGILVSAMCTTLGLLPMIAGMTTLATRSMQD